MNRDLRARSEQRTHESVGQLGEEFAQLGRRLELRNWIVSSPAETYRPLPEGCAVGAEPCEKEPPDGPRAPEKEPEGGRAGGGEECCSSDGGDAACTGGGT